MAGINRIWNVKYHVRRKRDSQLEASRRCGDAWSDTCHSFYVAIDIGHSPSGKAQHFDCCIRWFESNMPCSGFTWFPRHWTQQFLSSSQRKAVKSRHKAREGLIVYNPTMHERENQPVVKTSVIGRVDIYTPLN